MEGALKIIKDESLTYHQKLLSLAQFAENTLDVLKIDDKINDLRDKKIICDLYEGNAPYRPRYIIVDFEKFMKNGSEFLNLKPATNIYEATNNLLILYKNIPSITSFPVYLGNLDTLLEPFIKDEIEAYGAIKNFLLHIDRTLTDSFCHANIGPNDSIAGHLILKATKELQCAIPNLTMKVSATTPKDFILDGIDCALKTAKPSFANDQIFAKEFNNNYAIASCYNGLPISGGAYTLTRLNLANLSKESTNPDEFLENILPNAVKLMCEYMDERIRFLVCETPFFKESFLVKEGLIDVNNFSAMFGLVGLAECTNNLLNLVNCDKRYGKGKKATDFALTVIQKIDNLVKQHHNKYCTYSNNKFLLHAQVGISDDIGITPGCRVPIKEDIELFDQLLFEAKFHKYFPSGIGNIYPFDKKTKENPSFAYDILKGSFENQMRYFSLYADDADVIRITGYLVKKSDIKKLQNNEQVYSNSVVLGMEATQNHHILERKVNKND